MTLYRPNPQWTISMASNIPTVEYLITRAMSALEDRYPPVKLAFHTDHSRDAYIIRAYVNSTETESLAMAERWVYGYEIPEAYSMSMAGDILIERAMEAIRSVLPEYRPMDDAEYNEVMAAQEIMNELKT